jgi:drug/metabolite transporter (DMT)-like permease
MGAVPETVPVVPSPPRHLEAFAAAMLVTACFCWALFFPLGKNWQNAARDCPGGELVGSLTLIGIRPLLALAVFALVRPRLFLKPSRRAVCIGCLLGFLNFVGNALQVWGLASTSPALSGFFTSLASLWVPLLAFVCCRLPVTGATWLGLLLGLGGLSILGIDPSQGWGLGKGDGLTVLASFVFAVLILLLDRLGRTIESSDMTLSFIAMTGLPAVLLTPALTVTGPGFTAWLAWLWEMLCDPVILRDVLILTLFSTVLATYLMSTYQPRVAASRAALIYLLEPVLASTLSVLWGHDAVTWRLLVGGGLILGGNVIVELPLWLRDLWPEARRAND